MPSMGESSRRGDANAGAVAIKVTKTSAAILVVRERRIHPPSGSRERALLSKGALSLGVTRTDISLPQKSDLGHEKWLNRVLSGEGEDQIRLLRQDFEEVPDLVDLGGIKSS